MAKFEGQHTTQEYAKVTRRETHYVERPAIRYCEVVAEVKRGEVISARLLLNTTCMDVDGKQIRLAPEINITAEIKMGKRRVIEYLISPIQRAEQES